MAGGKDKIFEWLSLKTLPGECVTLAIGALGAALFVFLHIPGGSMSGSVIAVALTTIYARPAQLGGPLRVLALSTMGMAIGSVVGPETFSNMAAYPATMALMVLCVVCMTLASTLVWSWLMGWPPAMALLSSVPGSMSYIVSVSMSLGADAAKIAVVQMSRVIFLVTVLPFIVVWESGGHLGVISHAHADTLHVLIPTLAIGIAVGALFTWAGMGGGMLFGALVASGAIHYLGYGEGRAPGWVLDGGQVLLGSWVGTRFIGFDWRLFGKICIGTTASVGAAMAVSVVFSMIVSTFFGVSFGTALMAYAPGGQDAMMVLALSLGVDPIFVSAHHLARYFVINLTLPFIVGRMLRAKGADTSGGAP